MECLFTLQIHQHIKENNEIENCYRNRESIIRIDCVKNGNNRSCGCKSPNKGYKERRKIIGEDYPFHVLTNVFRKNAKSRKIPFEITEEDIKFLYEKQKGLCVYTKKELTLPKNYLFIFEPTVASIDRIDSSLGYTIANIQLVAKQVNMMKITLSHDEFVGLCKLISIHHS